MPPAQMTSDAAFGEAWLTNDNFLFQRQLGVEELKRPAPEHRQRTVRRHGADRLRVIEIIAELRDVGVLLVLARHQAGLEQPFRPQPLAQLADQQGILGPALAQQIAHAVQHCGCIGKAQLDVDEPGGLGQRRQRRVGEQPVGQRLQPRLAGDHALGAALLFEGQIQVFQLLLGRRGPDDGAQHVGELALLVNALQHRGTALFQLAQVGEARLQRAQLDVIQAVGHLLAVAGDERHRRPAVEQIDSCLDLCRPSLQLGGNL